MRLIEIHTVNAIEKCRLWNSGIFFFLSINMLNGGRDNDIHVNSGMQFIIHA